MAHDAFQNDSQSWVEVARCRAALVDQTLTSKNCKGLGVEAADGEDCWNRKLELNQFFCERRFYSLEQRVETGKHRKTLKVLVISISNEFSSSNASYAYC